MNVTRRGAWLVPIVMLGAGWFAAWLGFAVTGVQG